MSKNSKAYREAAAKIDKTKLTGLGNLDPELMKIVELG